MTNPWMDHLNKVRQENPNLSLKEALQEAKKPTPLLVNQMLRNLNALVKNQENHQKNQVKNL